MKNNMRKIIIILSILITGIIFCSYSKNNNITVDGFINVYGNEPFTYIGIKTENNKEYALNASDDVLKELRASQGKKIEIIGLLIPKDKDSYEMNMLKDGRIEVTEWSIVE